MTEEKKPLKTLSVEETAPLFMDDGLALIVPQQKLFRVDSPGYRYYYTVTPAGEPVFYLSVTSFTRSVLPESKFLTDWRVRLGKEESEEAARVAAAYGTFLHILIANFIREGYYDHRETYTALDEYMVYEGIPMRFYGLWIEDLENDMLAFAQFCHDKEVKPLAIEFPIFGMDGLAGMIDLPCSLLFNGKRVVALVDFKSGRKGFWDDHELQLVTYKRLWNGWFKGTDYEAAMIFNWAPNDWRKAPTYKLQNQTGSVQEQKFDHYHSIFKLDGNRTPSKTIKHFAGPIEFGENPEGKYMVTDLVTYISGKIRENAQG